MSRFTRVSARPSPIRRAAVYGSAAALAAASVFAIAPAAHAAPVTDFDDLSDALFGDCVHDSVVVLGDDFDEPGEPLWVNCDLTLDINGHDLTVKMISTENFYRDTDISIVDSVGGGMITVNAYGELTAGIDGSGGSLTIDADIHATGGVAAAGIGAGTDAAGHPFKHITINGGDITATGHTGIGGSDEAGIDNITINGGDITATGAFAGAGIGAGDEAHVDNITINGGTVNATGGRYAAGIGASRQAGVDNLTINGGDITATGGELGGAGIGGSSDGVAHAVTINGGDITATGTSNSAGIGEGNRNGSPNITITDGDVTATGDGDAPGIGTVNDVGSDQISISGGSITAHGGDVGAGINSPTVTMSGGTVEARGGDQSAGIGGRSNADGVDVTIGAGAVVTAVGGPGVSAVGHGEEGNDFGSLSVDGTLYLPEGILEVSDTDGSVQVQVGATGKILGAPGDETDGAEFRGDGLINNGGVIALTDDLVSVSDVSVRQHNYLVHFADADQNSLGDPVVLFASNFDDGYRSFPDVPVPEGMQLAGWVTEEGEPVDGQTRLPDVAGADWLPTETGEPSADTLYPAFEQISAEDDEPVNEDDDPVNEDDAENRADEVASDSEGTDDPTGTDNGEPTGTDGDTGGDPETRTGNEAGAGTDAGARSGSLPVTGTQLASAALALGLLLLVLGAALTGATRLRRQRA